MPVPSTAPSPQPSFRGYGLVTAAMAVSSSDGSSSCSQSVCSSGCTQGTVGPTASSLSLTSGTTAFGFGLHSNSSGYPTYVGVDVTEVYPDGVALNQLVWGAHVRCFGGFEVHGSHDAAAWADGNYDGCTEMSSVLAGTWVTVATGLSAPGAGTRARKGSCTRTTLPTLRGLRSTA